MRIDGPVLNPGILRHQITWQRKAVTGQNGFGEDVWSWADVLTCKAQVRSLTGRELANSQQTWPDARYHITQHYSRGLGTEMQIQWFVDGEVRTLDVLDIQDQAGTQRMQIVLAKDHGA